MSKIEDIRLYSYYSLYPDVFDGCAKHVTIPSYFESSYTWPKFNKVQDGNTICNVPSHP